MGDPAPPVEEKAPDENPAQPAEEKASDEKPAQPAEEKAPDETVPAVDEKIAGEVQPTEETPKDVEENKSPRKEKTEVVYETEKLFEMEDPEGLGDDWETTPYVEPSLDAATTKGLSMRFMAGKADFFDTTISELGSEGVGVGLYFLILRSLYTSFLVMAVIAVPPLAFNILGAGVSPAEQDSMNLALTTLGNQGLSTDNINPKGGCIDHTLMLRCYNGTDGEAGEVGFLAAYDINVAAVLDGNEEATLTMIPESAWTISKTGFQDDDVNVADITIVDAYGDIKVRSAERAVLEETFHCEVTINLVPEVGHAGFKAQVGVDCSKQFLEVPYGNLLVWDRIRVSSWIAASDFFSSIFLGIVMMFMYLRVSQVIDSNDLQNTTASDFAVFVRGLPKDTTEEELIEHFSHLFDLSSEERNVTYPGFFWHRKKAVKNKKKIGARINSLQKMGSKNNLNAVTPAMPTLERNFVTDMAHQKMAPDDVKEKYKNKWVAEVEVVNPNGYVLNHYLSKSSLSRKTRKAKQSVKKLKSKNKPTDKMMKKVEKLQAKLKKSEDSLYAERSVDELKELQHCIGAFIIFNHIESQVRCVDAYRNSGVWLGRFFQNKELKFKGRALKVISAPEPSDIQWENLDKSTKELILRKLFTLFITFLLLIVSILTILWAQGQKKNFAEKTPNISLCKEIPATFYGDYEKADELFYDGLSIVRIPELDEQCTTLNGGALSYYMTFGDGSDPVDFNTSGEIPDHTGVFGTNATYYAASQNVIGQVTLHQALGFGSHKWLNETIHGNSRYEYEQAKWDTEFDDWVVHSSSDAAPVRCDSPCVTPSSEVSCRFPCFKDIVAGSSNLQCPNTYDGLNMRVIPQTYTQTDLAGCYCKDRLALELKKSSGFFALFSILSDLPEEEPMCKAFIDAYGSSLGVVIGAAGMIAVINTVLKLTLKKLAKFEGHDSLSDQAASVSINLLIVQFINTALIAYFVNLSYDGEGLGTVTEFFKLFGLFDGDYEGFPPSWYTGVGAALILVMILQIVIPHAGPAFKYLFLRPLLKFILKRKATTQRDLDKLMIGDPFPIDTRMPEVLNTFFTTMLYCGGIPILIPFAMCNFFVSFQLDKLWYLRLYGGTPAYDASIARAAIKMMPIALMLHLLFSFLMYGDPDTLASELYPISHSQFPVDATDPGLIAQFLEGTNPRTGLPTVCDEGESYLNGEFCGWVNQMNVAFPLGGIGSIVWGPLSRTLLYSALPIFFLFVFVVGLYVSYRLIGHIILLILAQIIIWFIQLITFGKYPKDDHKATNTLEARIAPAYTELFKLLQTNGRPRYAADDVKTGKFVVEEDGHFFVMRCLPKHVPKGKDLTAVIDNFGLVTDKESPFLLHALKTWQQMPLHSYRIYANDKYRTALSEANVPMNVVEEVILEVDDDEGAAAAETAPKN